MARLDQLAHDENAVPLRHVGAEQPAEEGADEVAQALARRHVGRPLGQRYGAGAARRRVANRLDVKVFLAAEVVVDGGGAGFGRLGDVADGDAVEALLGEQGPGHRQDSLTGIFRFRHGSSRTDVSNSRFNLVYQTIVLSQAQIARKRTVSGRRPAPRYLLIGKACGIEKTAGRGGTGRRGVGFVLGKRRMSFGLVGAFVRIVQEWCPPLGTNGGWWPQLAGPGTQARIQDARLR